jgi:sugar/nucleoside kinase (ribokinase family)
VPATGAPVTEAAAMDLIAFGRVFLEIVFGQVPSMPGPGEEIFADEFAISCGGAVTVASAARRSGIEAGLSALLGDDLGSRVVAEHCRRAGVDLSPSRHVTGRVAGITVVLNFAGDRAFVSYLPPHAPASGPDTGHWLEILRDQRPAWCYLQPWPGAAALIGQARALGIHVALDVGLNAIDSDPRAVVSCAHMADVFLPNAVELLRLTGAGSLIEAIDTAAAWCPCLVVKRGAEGAIVADAAGRTAVTEGISPVSARDRTGAGDAFAGALIAALHRGAPIAEAAAAGNAAGSQTVTMLGAVGEVDVDGLAPAAASLAAALLAGTGGPAAAPGGGGPDAQDAGPDGRAYGEDSGR